MEEKPVGKTYKKRRILTKGDPYKMAGAVICGAVLILNSLPIPLAFLALLTGTALMYYGYRKDKQEDIRREREKGSTQPYQQQN
jgi:hypothetical protein